MGPAFNGTARAGTSRFCIPLAAPTHLSTPGLGLLLPEPSPGPVLVHGAAPGSDFPWLFTKGEFPHKFLQKGFSCVRSSGTQAEEGCPD